MEPDSTCIVHLTSNTLVLCYVLSLLQWQSPDALYIPMMRSTIILSTMFFPFSIKYIVAIEIIIILLIEIVIHLHSDFFTCSTCHLLNTPTPLDSVHRHGDDAFKRAVKQTVGSESQIPCQGDRLTFPSMDSSSLVVGLLAPLLHKLNIQHWHELYSIFSLSLVVQV